MVPASRPGFAVDADFARTARRSPQACLHRVESADSREGPMDGIHLLGEWYGCPADEARIHSRRARCARCASRPRKDAGLTVVGERFHQFEPQGVTGAVILAESHLAIHTWPEIGFVTLDVYVCNYTTDNTAKAERAVPCARSRLEARSTRASRRSIAVARDG